jgi:hypothetical protein
MYVLRIEIEIPSAADDVAAREEAKAIYYELNLGPPDKPSPDVAVKLQKRDPRMMPRAVRFP